MAKLPRCSPVGLSTAPCRRRLVPCTFHCILFFPLLPCTLPHPDVCHQAQTIALVPHNKLLCFTIAQLLQRLQCRRATSTNHKDDDVPCYSPVLCMGAYLTNLEDDDVPLCMCAYQTMCTLLLCAYLTIVFSHGLRLSRCDIPA